MKKLSLLFALITIISFFVCEGPMGPTGATGANGPQGIQGVPGASPNVYYFDIPLKNYIFESYNNSWNAYGWIDGVTIQITDLVFAYVKLSSDGLGENYWQPLPYCEFIDTNIFIQHSFGIMDIDDDTGNGYYLAGDIMFSLLASDAYPPYNNMNTDDILMYNVFIINGQEGKKAKLPDGINVNNRDEIKKYVESLQAYKE